MNYLLYFENNLIQTQNKNKCKCQILYYKQIHKVNYTINYLLQTYFCWQVFYYKSIKLFITKTHLLVSEFKDIIK